MFRSSGAIRCALCLLLVLVTTRCQNDTFAIVDKFATPCYTPNLEEGFCVELSKCHVLLNDVGKAGWEVFALQSRCGPKNEIAQDPRVCCGKRGVPSNATAMFSPTTATATTEDTQVNTMPKECGHQEVRMDTRIVGGTSTRLGQYPWLARLRHRNTEGKKSYSCSAFLIAPKYVLTAAHCVWSDALSSLGPVTEVQLGEHNTDTDIDCDDIDPNECAPRPQVIRTGRIMVHPGYQNRSTNRHNDIALVPLKKPAEYNRFVQPICLLRTPIMGYPLLELSGWGTTETDLRSNVKLAVSVRRVDFKECADKYKNLDVTLVESQLCAGGEKNRDSCAGDSGGPLMLYQNEVYYAAGIVSFGVGCGKQGWPGVYTNIPNFVSWIEGIMDRRRQRSVRNRNFSYATKH